MIKKMGIRWNLRKLMAARDMFQTTDLGPALAERGIHLSRECDASSMSTPPTSSSLGPCLHRRTNFVAVSHTSRPTLRFRAGLIACFLVPDSCWRRRSSFYCEAICELGEQDRGLYAFPEVERLRRIA